MPGAVSTKVIKDASGNNVTMRVWDESGAGTGPFSFFTVLGADGVKLAKAEDAAHSSGDEGFQVLAVRKDAPVSTAADGDYEPLKVDANGKQWVNASDMTLIDVTLSLDTNAYASGDLLADTQAVANAVRLNAGYGILHSVMVIDEDDQGAAFDIYFLSANNTLGTENSAPSISDANAREILCVVPVATSDYKDLGGVKIAGFSGLNRIIRGASGSTSIYVAVVNGSGTPTYTASGVKLRVGIIQN